jgi:hypothetical protein
MKDIGFSDKIHFVWGDLEGPHDTFVPLYDLQLKKIQPLEVVKMQHEPLSFDSEQICLLAASFEPMKPSKRFYDVDDALAYMFKTGSKYALEKKWNGFRALIFKKGHEVKIFSENKRDITKYLPTMKAEATQMSDKDFILDSELVIGNGGRSEVAKFFQGTPGDDDGKVIYHIFDILQYGDDITDKPWFERKQTLHSLKFTTHGKEVNSIIVDTAAEAKKAITLLRNLPGSEGAMIKRYDGKYKKNAESDAWIKFRNIDTIVARVAAVNTKANGKTYTMEIKAPNKANPAFVKDGYLQLGDTFVTDVKAAVGDNIEVQIEEVWRHEYPSKDDAIRFSVHKPLVTKKTEAPLTTADSLDRLAVSKGELVTENQATTTDSPGIDTVQGKEIKKKPIKPKSYYENMEADKAVAKILVDLSEEVDDEFRLELCETFFNKDVSEDEEGGTRSAAAVTFWKNNWQNMYPKDGDGKFVYQHHWRGLTEEEANTMTNEELMNTDHSVHGDFRGEINPNELFGFTVFLGTTLSNKEAGGDKFIAKSKDKADKEKIQGTFKLAIPHAWLTVGEGKGTISKPQGVGATSKKYAKFFIIDKGTYDIGVWREHSFELFLHGDELKGRAIIQYAPVGGQRIWLIDFPKDQTPYADSHNKEDVIKELKSKGQKYLIWAKPGVKPEKITI